jgi:putative endonuclease
VKYFTYIIESVSNKSWYIGHTSDINRRIEEHNVGENKSTRNKGPWRLIFLRDFETKLEANRFEMKLNKLRNRIFIKKQYSEFFLKD